ncbi:MAG: pilus biosynthesis protein [Silanimonas sp.]|nr:MAG: pilus biosynthesis protein [Silanimonas sp.]
MSTSRLTPVALVAALTLSAGLSSPLRAQAAALPISQEPLYVTNRIKPAFIMAVDDSGSMAWETLFPTIDGRATWNGATASFFHPTQTGADGRPRIYRSDETGNGNGLTNYLELFPFNGRSTKRNAIPPIPYFGFARSHEWNPAYFNPFVTYGPWARADRSEWPQATATAVVANPRAATSATNPTFNLTQDIQQDGNNWRFNVRVGMRIPAGTVYSRNTGNNCNFGGTQIGTTGWWRVNTETTATANCTAGFRYYPATFYLSSPTFPGYTATPLAVTNAPGGPPGVTLYRYEIKPDNMTPAAYSATMQNFANWFQYYRDRNLAMVAAMTRAFVDVDFMRVGYFRINNRVAVTMYDMGIQAERNAFYNLITALPANGGTPNRFAIQHMGEQFRRTGAGAPVQLACQMNAGMLFTDGYSNGGGPTVGNLDGGMGPPFADAHPNKKGDIVANYYLNPLRTDLGLGQVRVPAACSAPNPDPRLDCRTDPHMNFYGVTLGALGAIYGANATATANPYANPPAWAPACDNCVEAVDELWQATLIGRGKYINAKNPQAVSEAMVEVVNAVLDSTQPVGTPPVSGARVGTDSAIYQPGFVVRNNARDWVGSLQAFRLNADGSIGSMLWDAGATLPPAASRNILAMRVPGPTAIRQVVPFQAANFGGTEAAIASTIGVSLPSFLSNFTSGSTMADAFNYLRGDQSKEQSPAQPLGFRQRSGRLGDIINSNVEVETRRTFYPAFDALPAPLGDSYRAYLNTKRSSFTNTVFVGANAGMLHAFNADTGAELFAYVPNGALSNMGLLLARNYQHRYYVDGQINVTDAVIGGNWGTVLLGSMGRGGRSVFAIDVTNPAAVNASRVMWELPTADNDLGISLGRVEVMYAEDGNWYAVFANGLNSVNANPVLYVVNLTTGVVVRRITAEDGGDFTNGLTRIAIADVNGNGRVDTVYGGDFLGNLWKFDLSSTNPASWGVAFGGQPLFRARDINGDPQPITGGIAIAGGPSGGVMVSFGTGRYLTDSDAVTGAGQQLQTVYGVWDRGTVSGLTRASLQQQQILSQFGTGTNLGRVLSNNRVNYATQNGWFMDLRVGSAAPSGERMIGDPRIIGETITIPTSEPSGDSQCAPGLRSWGYRLDLFSGGPVLNRMERPGGSPVCPTVNCGALLVQAGGAPVTGSTVVQPQRPCRRGIDPECPAIANPELIASACGSPDPSAPTYNPNYDQCVENQTTGSTQGLTCSISNPIGTQDFGGEPQVCGRQSWRQVR